MFVKLALLIVSLYVLTAEGVKCPDQTSCPESMTCCILANGRYGCCPYKLATCCPDKIHCCPHGTTCDMNDGSCSSDFNNFNWMVAIYPRNSLSFTSQQTKEENARKEKKSTSEDTMTALDFHDLFFSPRKPDHNSISENSIASLFNEVSAPDVVCPGGRYTCPTNNTCCSMGTNGIYGCCPMPKATCCPDHQNCCPHGYACEFNGCSMVSLVSRQKKTITDTATVIQADEI